MSELLSVEQTAAYLGVNPWIIDSAIRNGHLKATSANDRAIQLTRHALETWLNTPSRGL